MQWTYLQMWYLDLYTGWYLFVLQTDIMLFDSVLKWSPTHEDSAVPPDLVTVLAVEIEDIVETENTVETEETAQTENLKKYESLTH